MRWQGLEHADVAALHGLFQSIEEHDNPPYRTALDETDERYVVDWHGDSANVLGGFDVDGTLVAYGAVSLAHADTGTLRVYLEGGVAPTHRHRGIGSAVLDWQIGRAKQLLAQSDRGLPPGWWCTSRTTCPTPWRC